MKTDRKDNIMIITAIILMASGIVLSFLSFFLTIDHVIDSSVLWYFAQTLVYAASVFGITGYVETKLGNIKMTYNGK